MPMAVRRYTSLAILAATVIALPTAAHAAPRPSGATPAVTAQVPGVPLSCAGGFTAFNSSGDRYWYGYKDGQATTQTYRQKGLGYRPSALQNIGGMGSDTSFSSTDYLVTSGGSLRRLEWGGTKSGGEWTITNRSTTTLSNSWSNTREMAYSRYLYRLTGSTLTRYSLVAGKPSAPRTVSRTFGGVSQMVYERTVGSGSYQADVFLATTTSGQLREYRVPISSPSSWRSYTLKTSGFKGFRDISTGPCANASSRLVMGLTSTGRMSVWYDPNSTDYRGSDFRGGSTGTKVFGLKTYGQ